MSVQSVLERSCSRLETGGDSFEDRNYSIACRECVDTFADVVGDAIRSELTGVAHARKMLADHTEAQDYCADRGCACDCHTHEAPEPDGDGEDD
jgi:hypothetical protein